MSCAGAKKTLVSRGDQDHPEFGKRFYIISDESRDLKKRLRKPRQDPLG